MHAVAALRERCRSAACERRVRHRAWRAVIKPYKSWLLATAQCESRRRWHLDTGNGFYGGLQFTLSSWEAVGGRGMPHRAVALEQMYRGVRLRLAQGTSAWPVCG